MTSNAVEWVGWRSAGMYFDGPGHWGGLEEDTNDYRADFNPTFNIYATQDIPLWATNWGVEWAENPNSGTITVIGPQGQYGMEYLFHVNRPGKLTVHCDLTYIHYWPDSTYSIIQETVSTPCYALGGPIHLRGVTGRTVIEADAVLDDDDGGEFEPLNKLWALASSVSRPVLFQQVEEDVPMPMGREREGLLTAFEPQPILFPIFEDLQDPHQESPYALWKVQFKQPTGTVITWSGQFALVVTGEDGGMNATAVPQLPPLNGPPNPRGQSKPTAKFKVGTFETPDCTAESIKAGTVHKVRNFEAHAVTLSLPADFKAAKGAWKGGEYELELLSHLGDPLDNVTITERITEIHVFYESTEIDWTNDENEIAGLVYAQSGVLRTGLANAANHGGYSYNAKVRDFNVIDLPLPAAAISQLQTLATAAGITNFDINKLKYRLYQSIRVATNDEGDQTGGYEIKKYQLDYQFINNGNDIQVTRTERP